MKEYRDKKIILALLSEIEKKATGLDRPLKIMEVCGTHTMTIHRYGLKRLLNDIGISMLSGPGCPVCITPNSYHEAAIDLVPSQHRRLDQRLHGELVDLARLALADMKESLDRIVGDQTGIAFGPFEMEADIVLGILEGKGPEGMSVDDA